MGGVHNDSSILNLTPRQMGVLLSFVLVLKKLIDTSLDDEQLRGWSNMFMCLPYMFLQHEGSKPDTLQCENFYLLLQNEDVANIKVGMFKQKTKRVHESMDKKFDFRSRCYKCADDNVRAGDFSKAMEALTKVDAKVNLNNVEKAINESS